MKKLILVFTTLFLLVVGCGTVHHLPSENTHVSVTIKDSIRWKDSTVLVQVPVEHYVDVVRQYDTLKLESTLARSVSYVDTLTHTLKGKLEQKPKALTTTIKYKDRIVTEYRDSISIKEVPVEVEVIREVVPKWSWWSLVFNVLVLLVFDVRVYLKLMYHK